MAMRARFELFLASATAADRPGLFERIEQAFASMDFAPVSECGSRSEELALGLPLGGWDEKRIRDGSWRIEGATAIAWALQLIKELPPYDQMVDVEDWDGLLEERDPELRSEAVIAHARGVAESWNWRARTALLEKDGLIQGLPEGWTREKFLRSRPKSSSDAATRRRSTATSARSSPIARCRKRSFRSRPSPTSAIARSTGCAATPATGTPVPVDG